MGVARHFARRPQMQGRTRVGGSKTQASRRVGSVPSGDKSNVRNMNLRGR